MLSDVKTKFKHYVLQSPVYAEDIINHTYTIEHVISAKVTNMAEEACVQACIEAAKEAGITDLYLLDRKTVIDALIEKILRDGGA